MKRATPTAIGVAIRSAIADAMSVPSHKRPDVLEEVVRTDDAVLARKDLWPQCWKGLDYQEDCNEREDQKNDGTGNQRKAREDLVSSRATTRRLGDRGSLLVLWLRSSMAHNKSLN